MWISLAARTVNPPCSIRLRIWPATPLATASGLMMASVHSVIVAGAAGRVPTVGGLRQVRVASSPEHPGDGGAHVGRAPDQRRPRGLERLHLLRGGPLPAGDDGTRVPHPAAGRRRLATDERDDRLLDMGVDEGRRLLLRRPADLADHHDRPGGRVVVEQVEHVDEVRAVDGIAADPDARGLPDAAARELADDLVRERPAARDDADGAGRVDVARHDADLRPARRAHARAVRAHEPARRAREEVPRADHVGHRDALGDAHDQRHARGGGLHDRVGRRDRRHEDQRAGGALRRDGVGHVVPDREALVRRAALAGRPAADDGGPVLLAAPRVESALAPRDPLDHDAGRRVDQDAHAASRASATTLRAPSPMSSAVTSLSPDSASIFLPRSTFVPSMRTTTGSRSPSFFTAAITPSARRSQRRIPPKTLMKTAFTAASDDRIRNACSICSGEAPPPTSRKLTGSPPASLMMSIVAIARPAPLTMQPTLPSSLM